MQDTIGKGVFSIFRSIYTIEYKRMAYEKCNLFRYIIQEKVFIIFNFNVMIQYSRSEESEA